MRAAKWHPGSFTKNFSWGASERGLRRLYDIIRVGFDGQTVDTPRHEFRNRIRNEGVPDYIPLNFFLLNRVKDGIDYVLVDELVYTALTTRHSQQFDKLALLTFNTSLVGRWKGAASYQNRPALWAHFYIRDRIADQLEWTPSFATADDIDKFVSSDARYVGATSRKLATNLAYLYKLGRLRDFTSKKPEKWWVSGIFMTLDRVLEQRKLDSFAVDEQRLGEYLIASGFHELSGKRSIEKDLVTKHFVTLYVACGGRDRFDVAKSQARQQTTLSHLNELEAGLEALGVFHPTNVQARGIIPNVCRLLARYSAEFETFDLDGEDGFDAADYVTRRTDAALSELRQAGVVSVLSSEEILKMTRDG